MNPVTPATPGWYARQPGGPRRHIVAWFATENGTDDVLLPFVEQNPGKPPLLYTVARIDEGAIEIGYDPPTTHRMF